MPVGSLALLYKSIRGCIVDETKLYSIIKALVSMLSYSFPPATILGRSSSLKLIVYTCAYIRVALVVRIKAR
jgi:hypothetical protein